MTFRLWRCFSIAFIQLLLSHFPITTRQHEKYRKNFFSYWRQSDNCCLKYWCVAGCPHEWGRLGCFSQRSFGRLYLPRLAPMPLSCEPPTLSNTSPEQLKTSTPPGGGGLIQSQAESEQLIVWIDGAVSEKGVKACVS